MQGSIGFEIGRVDLVAVVADQGAVVLEQTVLIVEALAVEAEAYYLSVEEVVVGEVLLALAVLVAVEKQHHQQQQGLSSSYHGQLQFCMCNKLCAYCLGCAV